MGAQEAGLQRTLESKSPSLASNTCSVAANANTIKTSDFISATGATKITFSTRTTLCNPSCSNGDYLYKGRRLLHNLLSGADDSTLEVVAKLEKQNADLLVQNAMLKDMVKRMCSKMFP